MQEVKSRTRLNSTLAGFPRALVPAQAFDQLARFYIDLDALGRLDPHTGEPLIDEHTLFAMLREYVGKSRAEVLVRQLGALPGSAFRPAHQSGLVTEVSWFDLAEHVVILDASPSATFAQLDLPARPSVQDVVTAVRARFPSMEEELLQPNMLPPRIEALLQDEGEFNVILHRLARQLGWWAAFVAVLLIPPMVVTRSTMSGDKGQMRVANAWPLSMYFITAAVGGWTLTVVGSCILAPTD